MYKYNKIFVWLRVWLNLFHHIRNITLIRSCTLTYTWGILWSILFEGWLLRWHASTYCFEIISLCALIGRIFISECRWSSCDPVAILSAAFWGDCQRKVGCWWLLIGLLDRFYFPCSSMIYDLCDVNKCKHCHSQRSKLLHQEQMFGFYKVSFNKA